MKIYIKNHNAHAGKWIYKGYYSAWKFFNFETIYYENLEEIKDDSDFYLMTLDSCINKDNLNILDKAKKVFLFVQPTHFEMPWGNHPNFISFANKFLIQEINKRKNIFKWTFSDKSNFYLEWEKVHTLPLAFDHINYDNFFREHKYNFDVCFIGGRANNGFDEKYKIMLEIFSTFKKSNLKCGFFIDKNITHEQEKNIIYNSKVCLNIHDAYQKKLGLDTNERTFKTLGINGLLVSDDIQQIKNLFPDLKTAKNAEEYLQLTNNFLNMNEQEIFNIKKMNKQHILDNHTYVSRVRKMMNYDI